MATETDKDALIRAINNADDIILRDILKSVCESSEVCRKEVMDRMLLSRKHRIIEISDSSDSDSLDSLNSSDSDFSEDEDEKKRSKKRQKTPQQKKQKRTIVASKSRFEVCETCDETYDVTLNHSKACQTHEDILELDPECFPDDDQVYYDPSSIDVKTDWRRETCPEGFVWQCCDEPLDGEACLIQRHIPKKSKKEYARS
ncbi:hypothetical protein F5Y07DRAFT_248002 [Xylaria sp. FL0933]|nr:hypothetical protein F5Y07DRAFT_248002 [Xylaria sp. FL0933]